MIACPKISRNEWKTAERGAFSRPGAVLADQLLDDERLDGRVPGLGRVRAGVDGVEDLLAQPAGGRPRARGGAARRGTPSAGLRADAAEDAALVQRLVQRRPQLVDGRRLRRRRGERRLFLDGGHRV